jgi:hypothetical protein
MIVATDYAFDIPVRLYCASVTLVRSVEQAACILRSNLQERFTMEGLNTLLMLERAAEGYEIEEARLAFCLWASHAGLAS